MAIVIKRDEFDFQSLTKLNK